VDLDAFSDEEIERLFAAEESTTPVEESAKPS
jgi:hypothetical protein